MNVDSIKVNDTLKYLTPKGKTVYGGGGIIPDVFVAIDTTRYFNSMHYSSLNNFVFDYIDTHRDDFKGLSFDDFKNKYYIENNIFNKYLLTIATENVDKNDQEFRNINMYLKALFVQQIYDDNAFYQILNQNDKMLEKIIDLEKEGYAVTP
jgi:carboxyl-terminal processing protease